MDNANHLKLDYFEKKNVARFIGAATGEPTWRPVVDLVDFFTFHTFWWPSVSVSVSVNAKVSDCLSVSVPPPPEPPPFIIL